MKSALVRGGLSGGGGWTILFAKKSDLIIELAFNLGEGGTISIILLSQIWPNKRKSPLVRVVV